MGALSRSKPRPFPLALRERGRGEGVATTNTAGRKRLPLDLSLRPLRILRVTAFWQLQCTAYRFHDCNDSTFILISARNLCRSRSRRQTGVLLAPVPDDGPCKHSVAVLLAAAIWSQVDELCEPKVDTALMG